jgi:hypothetical protein
VLKVFQLELLWLSGIGEKNFTKETNTYIEIENLSAYVFTIISCLALDVGKLNSSALLAPLTVVKIPSHFETATKSPW